MKFCLISPLQTYGPWRTAGNEIRAWAHALMGDVHCGTDIDDYNKFSDYDVIMIELTSNMLPVVIELRLHFTGKLIGLVEGNLVPDWGPIIYPTYLQALDVLDTVGIINPKAYDIFTAITSTPVRFIGIPYPVAWARDNVDLNSTNLLELGSSPVDSRGGFYNLAVYKHSKIPGVTYVRDDQEKILVEQLLVDVPITTHQMTDWQTYFKQHSTYHVGVHLDHRATWGRYPLDCAAAGIPCVSTIGSYTQTILFPELTVVHYEIGRAQQLVARLYNDAVFYDRIVRYARDQLPYFDLQPTAQRFLNLL